MVDYLQRKNYLKLILRSSTSSPALLLAGEGGKITLFRWKL